MKIIIDTTAKTIELCENISLDELQKELKKMFPNEWKEYKLLSPPQTSVWTFYNPNIIPAINPVFVPYSDFYTTSAIPQS